MKKALTQINWFRILFFYAAILGATYLSRLLPNVLQIFLGYFTDTFFPWNYNHGIAVLLVTFVFYRFSKQKSHFSLLGNKKLKSLVFPLLLFAGYTIYGISNHQGMDKHLWALMFCGFTLVYDLMEEYAWRGYLIDELGKLAWAIKALISGVVWAVWHLLIFTDFDQFGGFGIFLLLCIVFSFLLTFSVVRTQSILVAATLHALLIKTNIVTLVLLIVFLVMLLTWNYSFEKLEKRRRVD